MSFAPYLFPYGLFMMLTMAGDKLTEFWAPAAFLTYPAKLVGVTALLFYYGKRYTELRWTFSAPALLLAVAVGVAVIVPWIALDPYYPQLNGDEWRQAGRVLTGRAGEGEGWHWEHAYKARAAYNPWAAGEGALPIVMILVRVTGAVLMVPVFEELFVRSWVLRMIIDPDFEKVPVGKFTWPSFLLSSLFFGFSHHEWLAGILCGLAFCGVLYYRKNLVDVMIAHAVANLALALYVLHTGHWHFW